MREAFETNAASRPWMQLDMGEEVTVKKVTFQPCCLDYLQRMGKVVTGKGVLSTSPCKQAPHHDVCPIVAKYLSVVLKDNMRELSAVG